MKTIVKKTKKFASGINPNKTYYCIYKNKLSQIRVTKAENRSSCSDDDSFTFEYEIAGVGKISSTYEIPLIFETMDDAINHINYINLKYNFMCSVFDYCEEHKLISLKRNYNIMRSHSYIIVYSWNGYKTVFGYGVSPCGIEVKVNLLNGEITITCDDNAYTTQNECEKENEVVCETFA